MTEAWRKQRATNPEQIEATKRGVTEKVRPGSKRARRRAARSDARGTNALKKFGNDGGVHKDVAWDQSDIERDHPMDRPSSDLPKSHD